MHLSPALAPGGPGIQMTGALHTQAGSCLDKYCIIIWEVFRLHGKLTGPGSRGKPYEACAVLQMSKVGPFSGGE